jgi:GAF domain-containing protein
MIASTNPSEAAEALNRTLENLTEPLARVSATGETVSANAAFLSLAEHCRVEAKLSSLFGPAATALLEHGRQDGRARATLTVIVGDEPRPWYRLSTSPAPDNTQYVLLSEAAEEATWRRERLRYDEHLVVLKNLGASLSGTVEIDALTSKIYDQTSHIIQSANFYVALHDRDHQIVSFPRYIEEGRWQSMTSRPFSNGLTEYILRTGEPLLMNRRVIEEAAERGIEPVGRPCLAWMGVPMPSNGETIGVLAVQDYHRTDCYDSHDLEVLGIIAAQAAAAIQNARSLSAARRAYQELSEAQARLLETERVRGVTEAVGAMNHEVNNPLAAIAGNAQLLLRRAERLTPQSRAKIETILEAAKRIQQVTTKMSTLIQATSRPYPGETPILDLRHSIARDDPASVSLFPLPTDSLDR